MHTRQTILQLARRARLMLGVSVAWLPLLPAAGQLAITEVQSAPSVTPSIRGADYLELTNFGPEPVDLTDYWVTDSTGFAFDVALNLAVFGEPSQIAPLESIIFARLGTTMAVPEDFRQWWGESNLRPDLRIAVTEWKFGGFSNEKDAVQLWHVPAAGQPQLVDRVALFESDLGNTFTYDPTTGLLDRFSVANVDGAFLAATTTDVGSPGGTTGLVPVRIVEPPTSVEVDGGTPATLVVRAIGLPRPHYQWHFNGEPIVGATRTNLVIANAHPLHAGVYTVEVSNGLTNLLSAPAALTVNTNPSCAAIVRPPADWTVALGETPIFTVAVRGYPLPDFQWQFNGVDIPGATASSHAVVASDLGRAGLYTVRVSNALCSTNASARLTVIPEWNLVITEAMASPSTNTMMFDRNDWWELTNVGTNAVNLRGFRFDDGTANTNGAFVVTDDVIVQPGRSVVWVSDLTPEEFRRWWGEENLPEDLSVISYPGNGFDSSGDAIYLWSAAGNDWVVAAGVNDTNLIPTMGVSLELDPLTGSVRFPSVEGERGSFRAAEGGDIGSPGWTSNEQRVVRPRIKSIRRDATAVTLTWSSEPDRSYEVRWRDTLGSTNWNFLTTKLAESNITTAVDTMASNIVQRFYRVILLPQP
jgi:hypothetical protein